MEYTENYNLKKPDMNDTASISDINENMDIIDQKLKEAGQSEQLQSDVTEIKNDIGSPEDISTSPTIFGKFAELKEILTTKFSEIISKITSVDSKIGTTTDTGGTSSAGGIFAKLNKLLTDWTTTRASRIDSIYTNTTTNNTASTTGTLSQKLSSVISTLSSILTNTRASTTSSSTGTLSQKLNYIKGLIGTSGDSGTNTIFGKLTGFEKKQRSIAVHSDNIKYKILENANIKVSHTKGNNTYKNIILGVPKINIPSGTFKVKVDFSVKFDTESSSNSISVNLYTYNFRAGDYYSNLSLVKKIDAKPTGTVEDSSDRVGDYSTYLCSNGDKVSGTTITNKTAEGIAKICAGYCMELFVHIRISNTNESGYVIIKNVSICYDEVTE